MQKTKQILHSTATPFILIALVAIIDSFFIKQPLVSFITLLISAHYVGGRLRRDFFESTFAAIVLGFSVIVAVAGLMSVILWIPHIPLRLDIILYLSILLTMGIVARSTRRRMTYARHFDLKDLIAISVVALYFGVSLLGAVRHQPINLSTLRTAAIQYAANGGDGINHIMMYADTSRADRGMLLGSRDSSSVSKKDWVAYPKMSHTLGALVYRYNGITFTKTIYSFAFLYILFFALSLYVIARTSLEFADQALLKRGRRAATYFTYLPLFALLLLLPAHNFIEEGFFSVWPILVYMPLIILWFRGKDFSSLSATSILYISAFTTVIAISWPILGFPVYAALFAAWLLGPKRLGLKKYFALAMSVLGLVQLYPQYKTPMPDVDINSLGGIMSVSPFFVGVFSIAVVVILLLKQRRQFSIFNLTYALAVTVMVGLIGYLNLHATGSLQYYYMKSSFLMCTVLGIIVTPMLAGYIAALIDRSLVESSALARLATGFLGASMVVLASSLFFGLQSNVLYTAAFLGGSRHLSAQAANQLIINNRQLGNTFVLNLDNRLENFYTNGYLANINRLNQCQASFQAIGLSDNISQLARQVQTNCARLSPNKLSVVVIDDAAKTDQLSCSDATKLVDALPGGAPKTTFLASSKCSAL